MRYILALLFTVATIAGFAQVVSNADTLHVAPIVKNNITLTGTATVSTVGFSPVPSFSFDRPIASVTLSLSHKRFSYKPALSVGLNGKPWIIENWFKYLIINKKQLELSAGFNASLFFKTETLPGKGEILNANRNVTAGLFSDITVSNRVMFSLTYWYNKRCDKGTLSGHFADAAATITKICTLKQLYLTAKPELFYFNNTSSVDGFFASGYISIGHSLWPVGVFVQGVQPVWTNFAGSSFKWNTGVVYAF